MFVRGERVDTVRRPTAAAPAARRPRYCLRCGGPIGLSPGALTGVRCLNCGAQPSQDTRVQSATPPREFILPRRDIPVIRHEPVAVGSDQERRPLTPVAAFRPRGAVDLDIAGLRTWMRAWTAGRTRPSTRTMINAAAAGVAILIAVVVTLTLS